MKYEIIEIFNVKKFKTKKFKNEVRNRMKRDRAWKRFRRIQREKVAFSKKVSSIWQNCSPC